MTLNRRHTLVHYQTSSLRIKNYGWRELMEAMWIVATKKEEAMANLGITEEEAKWTKVKDKLAQIPKNVQR